MTQGSRHSSHVQALVTSSTKTLPPLLSPTDKACSRRCITTATYTVCRRKENTREGGAEIGFGGQVLQQSTHGILGGVSSPAFPLKLVGLAPAITLLFSGTCASSQELAELSECLS